MFDGEYKKDDAVKGAALIALGKTPFGIVRGIRERLQKRAEAGPPRPINRNHS